MVGRSITMKIMKRDPTAPVEPPKVSFCVILERRSSLLHYSFLGMDHATCSTSKSLSLALEVELRVMNKLSESMPGACLNRSTSILKSCEGSGFKYRSSNQPRRPHMHPLDKLCFLSSAKDLLRPLGHQRQSLRFVFNLHLKAIMTLRKLLWRHSNPQSHLTYHPFLKST